MKQPGRSGKTQNGRFVVAWIVGVLLGTALIGAGIYFGLGMLGGGNATAPGVAKAPSQPSQPAMQAPAPAAPAPAPEAPAPVPQDTASSMAAPSMSGNARPEPRAPGQSIQAAVNEQRAAAQAQRAPATPRPPTTGGIAAARLPTGEEILVPAGQRVDEYLAAKARERGIEIEDDLPPRVDDEAEIITLDTELREDDDPGDLEQDGLIPPREPN